MNGWLREHDPRQLVRQRGESIVEPDVEAGGESGGEPIIHPTLGGPGGGEPNIQDYSDAGPFPQGADSGSEP
jgi:hypothetical protein